jgi:hypothetical protein
VLAAAYSVRVRQENRALAGIPATVHRINHLYRDALSELFSESSPIDDEEIINNALINVLQSVTVELALLYTTLIHRRCVVSVKYIFAGDAGQDLKCFTLVRSSEQLARDADTWDVYDLRSNTAFSTASEFTPGKISHFYSGDLLKDARRNRYNNERPNWQRFYRSALVVPIRHVSVGEDCPGTTTQPPTVDTIGFLAVDTKSTHTLNA